MAHTHSLSHAHSHTLKDYFDLNYDNIKEGHYECIRASGRVPLIKNEFYKLTKGLSGRQTIIEIWCSSRSLNGNNRFINRFTDNYDIENLFHRIKFITGVEKINSENIYICSRNFFDPDLPTVLRIKRGSLIHVESYDPISDWLQVKINNEKILDMTAFEFVIYTQKFM
jgi:hypothetical protein